MPPPAKPVEAAADKDVSSVPVIPMAGAMVIASILGGPVCFLAGHLWSFLFISKICVYTMHKLKIQNGFDLLQG